MFRPAVSTRFIITAILGCVVALSAAPRAIAQRSAPVRAAFEFPETADKTGSLSDYDLLIGTWTFKFQTRRPDGTFNDAIAGHWTFEKKPGGALIEDRYRPDDPSLPMGVSLYTYRVFDSERKQWQVIGTSSNGGAVQLGVSWSDSGSLFVIQRAGRVLARFHYSSLEASHFKWQSDRSYDDGATWIHDFAVLEATRVGK